MRKEIAESRNDSTDTTTTEQKIKSKQANVVIIGLGYVGLPLASEFAKAGFKVVGIDTNKARVREINEGKSYIEDIEQGLVGELTRNGQLRASYEYDALKEADATIICVPTPLRKTKDPDVSYIVFAVKQISKFAHKGQLIILESTTYPGTCEEIILPSLTGIGLSVGKDFYLAFSPERIDPGNKKYTTKNIPKVVGGITPQCTKMAALLYEQVIDKVVPVSSTRTAEMVKLLENTFRTVNIGLINEFALICDRMGIDVWEAIEAAATKPFGFMPFYPGPGLGGHCLPIDPVYLSWKAKLLDIEAKFIDLAVKINASMPSHVVTKITDALNDDMKCVNGAKILILGVAYKKNVGDIRESPALDIIELLTKKGAVISYCDPHVPELNMGGVKLRSTPLTEEVLRETDCVAIVADHDDFDYPNIIQKVSASGGIIVDTRNVTKGTWDTGRIVKL